MKKNKVFKPKNKPSHLPLWETVTAYLLLSRPGTPGWFIGVVCTLMAFLWIAMVVGLCTEIEIDLFPDKETK